MDRGLAGGAGFCAGARHGHDLGFTVTATADRNAKKLRHDLENFASDAEGADAASLETAEMSLVPLSEFMDELKATAPCLALRRSRARRRSMARRAATAPMRRHFCAISRR